MSGVRFVFPKPRLAELLKMPGGLPVVEALERAQANLETIKPACRADLMSLLDTAEAAFAELGNDFDEVRMAGLYAIAVRGIGTGAVCGAPGVDTALTSLCDLLDFLLTGKRHDREAIGVHLQAWRLLMTVDLPQAGADSILAGLRKVTAKYAKA